jgi:hypothetical protein
MVGVPSLTALITDDIQTRLLSLPYSKTTFTDASSLFCRSDMVGVSLALAHCREEEVNTVVSGRDARTPLHLAAALGHLAIAQILIWVRGDK